MSAVAAPPEDGWRIEIVTFPSAIGWGPGPVNDSRLARDDDGTAGVTVMQFN